MKIHLLLVHIYIPTFSYSGLSSLVKPDHRFFAQNENQIKLHDRVRGGGKGKGRTDTQIICSAQVENRHHAGTTKGIEKYGRFFLSGKMACPTILSHFCAVHHEN